MGSWPKESPLSLEQICIEYCVNNLWLLVEEYPLMQGVYFRPSIAFPRGLSDKLLECMISKIPYLKIMEQNIFRLFCDRSYCVLTCLNLRHTSVDLKQLKHLCQHPVSEIDISYCEEIRSNYISAINQAGPNLKLLRMGGKLEGYENLTLYEELDTMYDLDRGDILRNNDKVLNCPNLLSLTIKDVNFIEFNPDEDCDNYHDDPNGIQEDEKLRNFFKSLFQPMIKLTQLDLSGCQLRNDYLDILSSLRCLTFLSLSDVLDGSVSALKSIAKIRGLRHLDISQGNDDTFNVPVRYSHPEAVLAELVQSLPHLTSLDISGTNLAGINHVEPSSHRLKPKSSTYIEEEPVSCCIRGLEGRHFDFLGLLDCTGDACYRQGIPAKLITGEASEAQILLSIHRYRDKPHLLTRGLNNLFQWFRNPPPNITDHCCALEGILHGMNLNKHDKHVQISGSASLFYIAKGPHKESITSQQKKRMIDCLLDAMERHNTETTMMRNGCLTLCHAEIPKDVMYCYDRLVKVLVNMLKVEMRQEYGDDFIPRIGIFLLNSLACQVDGKHKEAVGNLGVVEMMCKIIKHKLTLAECDEVLEVAWSTLWNVTDETPSNCQKFITEGGMQHFIACVEKFPEKEELLRNMMGLMGNIAEVKELRVQLMDPKYMSVIYSFLSSTKDGIEVSYNSAGVLSHIASDSPETWTIESPTRNEVLRGIVQAIERWPLSSKRNINYRSFEPILKLARCYHTPAVQQWAVWALCNLTQVYPDKYFPILETEKGIELLNVVFANPSTLPAVRMLANSILDTYRKFKDGTEQIMEDVVMASESEDDEHL
ncbi:hypothetical protein CHS0354_031725 [Potamilus streckersoni]|uniref:Protein zer-1 homolog n=1 Tax=Potamilus streckersoni TaxID=2493646 RepID=A0AAE0W9N3_9BIVA|nr:hypothetical protein CHS0354_031725 [Potamilus streckersoni]